MTRTIAIVSKPHHPLAEGLLRALITFCDTNGIAYLVDRDTHTAFSAVLQALGTPEDRIRPRTEIWKEVELMIVLGGDGTLISACRHIRDTDTRVMGVNLGTLGFLTDVLPDEAVDGLSTYLEGDIVTEPRPLLEIAITDNGRETTVYAMNDAVFNKQALARIFSLNVRVNEEEATMMRGDGLIISTPSGSTAYSLAAGGSIVHPSVDALLITPICPHSLSSRPLIIHGTDQVEVTLGSECENDTVYLTVDGQEGMSLTKGAQVTIAKSRYAALFVKPLKRGYYSNLKSKLRWGT